MAFAVHGTAELAFTGGAAALLAGIGVGLRRARRARCVAGLVFGVLGLRQRERDSVIGVVLAFGLGLGVLLLSLYSGRASNKFGLLVGSIVSVDSTNLAVLGGRRRAGARRARGALPAAAVRQHRPRRRAGPRGAGAGAVAGLRGADRADHGARRADRRRDPRALRDDHAGRGGRAGHREPVLATVLAVVFAEVALLGGTVLSLAPGLPISGYVAAIAFVLYVGCRVVGRGAGRRLTAVGGRDWIRRAEPLVSHSGGGGAAAGPPRPAPHRPPPRR